MVLVSRQHAGAVIEWLDANVSANQPYRVPDIERTQESRMNPYHVSTTAQIAYWRGEGDLWRVTQSARRRNLQVECRDPQIEMIIALKWSG